MSRNKQSRKYLIGRSYNYKKLTTNLTGHSYLVTVLLRDMKVKSVRRYLLELLIVLYSYIVCKTISTF